MSGAATSRRGLAASLRTWLAGAGAALVGSLSTVGACVTVEGLTPFPCPNDGCPEGLWCTDVGCVTEDEVGRHVPFECATTNPYASPECPSGYTCLPVGCVPEGDVASYVPFPCGTDGYEPNTCPETYVCTGDGCLPEGDLAAYEPFACLAATCPGGWFCLDGACISTNVCDPLTQTGCPEPARPKCAVVAVSATDTVRVCLPLEGQLGTGLPCERSSSGFDDCGGGDFCNATLSPDGGYVCRRYCGQSADCAPEEACFSVFGGQSVGLCAEPCELGGGDCAAGRSCKSFSGEVGGAADAYLLACSDDGPASPDASCDDASSCPAEHVCFGTCERLCHDDAVCGASSFCDFLLSDLGICACRLFGDACPQGSACTLFGSDADGYFTECGLTGPGGTGSPCGVGIQECQPGHVCYGNPDSGYTCHALCDLFHPCPAGTCQVEEGVPDQGGFCVP